MKGKEMSCMGRRVIHNSPARHPAQKDPLARQPQLDWTEGGPAASLGSDAYVAQITKRGRGGIGSFGKRGFKRNEYGSGSVN